MLQYRYCLAGKLSIATMALLKLYKKDNPPDRLQTVVRTLCDGGVVILPTDTTYALACHALKERAVERICSIRRIDPASHPLSVVCYDMSAISDYARISTPIYKIMRRNLPGPFTFILPGKNKLPKIFRHKKDSEVGIRMPDNPVTREILRVLDAPIMIASLPIDSETADTEYLIDPELIDEAFGHLVDLVVDGGMGHEGQSTIVDCHEDTPNILRQGDGTLQ